MCALSDNGMGLRYWNRTECDETELPLRLGVSERGQWPGLCCSELTHSDPLAAECCPYVYGVMLKGGRSERGGREGGKGRGWEGKREGRGGGKEEERGKGKREGGGKGKGRGGGGEGEGWWRGREKEGRWKGKGGGRRRRSIEGEREGEEE